MNAFRFVVVSPKEPFQVFCIMLVTRKATLQAFSPNGAAYASPGQRPGVSMHSITQALKGRFIS
jgi:hypothetical protein